MIDTTIILQILLRHKKEKAKTNLQQNLTHGTSAPEMGLTPISNAQNQTCRTSPIHAK
jgi:hypothetical protein